MKLINLYVSPLIKMLQDKPQDTPILYHNKQQFSVKDILINATNIAIELKINGFNEGDRVVLLAEPNLDFISALYAVIMCKGVTAIIDPDMGSKLYLNRLKQFEPKWIFIDYRLIILQKFRYLNSIYRKLKKNAFFIPTLDNTTYIIMGKSPRFLNNYLNINKFKENKSNNISWEQPISKLDFLVTYTSGTLDIPKGVLHSDYTLVNSLTILVQKIGKYSGQNMVSYLPHFALIGIMANVKVHLWKKEMSPKNRIKFINKYNINIFFGPPVEINELLDYCKNNKTNFPDSLKYILLGSAPIYKPFIKKLKKFSNAEIECLYGMTENLLVSSISAEEKLEYNGSGDIVGYPFEGVHVKVSKNDELLIRSNQLFSGYLHLSKRKNEDYHPTGDLGYVDKKNRIVLTGRKKNMIIRKEYNIYPGLYEPIINSIPEIDQAVMIGKYNNDKADEDIYLVVQKNKNITSSQIMKLLKTKEFGIDSSAIPDHIIFAEIPRKGRQQKIDYSALKSIVP